MERLTKPELEKTTKTVLCNYNKDECNDSCKYGLCAWNKKALHKLKTYEDTGLAPEQIEQLKSDKDFWEREAKKWCAKLGEIRQLVEGGTPDENKIH